MISATGFSPFKNPLVVALDVDSRDEALKLVDEIGDLAGGFKVGPRLCLREGAGFIKELAARAPVFMDNKHFDIPSTMEAAVRASFDCGASAVTVHALAGAEALKAMANVEKELNAQRPFRIIAVTILTSWSTLPVSLKPTAISQHVKEMAESVQASGLKSIVCSAEELELVGQLPLFRLVPGIRFADDAVNDQSRVSGPEAALAKGASALVVGRPIIQAKNPRLAALRFSGSLQPQA